MVRVLALCALASIALLGSDAEGGAQESIDFAEGIRSADQNMRRQAFASAIRERKRVIVALIAVVEDDKLREENPKAVACAMRLLGELRAIEAVGVLVGHISFRPDWTLPPYLPKEQRCPPVDALIKIGKPAERALLRMLSERTAGKAESSLAGYVIRQIEGNSELSLAAVKAYAEKLPPKAADRLLQNSVLLESLKK